ncbi:MAG: alpha-glucosidase [Deltaproteobacteria bacterium]|nr:alpha-glucosidase [Deltaproteobacteria bacterium]
MHALRFDSVDLGSDAVELAGSSARARLTVPRPGVIRLLVWRRPEDAAKGSWVVISPPSTAGSPPALSARHVGDAVHLSAPDSPELLLSLDPFRLRWGALEVLGLEAGRLRPLGAAQTASRVQRETLTEERDGDALSGGLTLELADPPSRRYYGLGLRTGFLDRRGRVWTNWATDDMHHHPDKDPLYQSHPFVLALEGACAFGLFLDESWRTVFDLGATERDRSLIHTDGPTFDLYLIAGPSPKAVLARYTELVGRPPLPPLWALGQHQCRWGYFNGDAVRAVARGYRERNLPLEALWLDIDHLEGFKVFTLDEARFGPPRELPADLRALDVRTVAIVDPGVKVEPGYATYDAGRALGAFVTDSRGEELRGEVWPKPAVWPDFTRPVVRHYWGEQHRGYVEAGVDGIWNDMNEPAAFGGFGLDADWKTLPPTARHGARSHAEVHNLYGLQMCQATHEGLSRLRPERRPFVLTRSGCAGIQRFAWVWTGDNHSYWEHLEASIPTLLGLGLSGVPFAGADVGGFSADTTGELLARWSFLGAFYPFMRNHSAVGTRRQEPWCFGEPYLSAVRAALELRYRLLPYLYTLAEEASRTGLPPMRPLLLEYPDDGEVQELHDQFLLGRELLVAPALRPGQRRRLVYLPAGGWAPFELGPATSGPSYVSAPTPLDGIPLFQRAGSAVPLTAVAPCTTTARWTPLAFRAPLAPELHGQVYEDDGDGFAPGARSELRGDFDGARLALRFVDGFGRADRPVTVELTGTPGLPRSCSVPARLERGLLVLELTGPEAHAHW